MVWKCNSLRHAKRELISGFFPYKYANSDMGEALYWGSRASNYWKMFYGLFFSKNIWLRMKRCEPTILSFLTGLSQWQHLEALIMILTFIKIRIFHIAWPLQIKFGFYLTKETTISSKVGRFKWFSRIILTSYFCHTVTLESNPCDTSEWITLCSY